MAKFLPGPAIAEIRGSVGGTVFSRNRYSAYTRNRTIPTVSTTAPAMLAKSRMTAATQAWQVLTATQRASWAQWALSNPVSNSLGQQQALTGHVAFVKHHIRSQIAAQSAPTGAPTSTPPPPLSSLAVTADIGLGDLEIAFTVTPLAAADRIWLFGAVVSSAGVSYVKNLYRFLLVSAVAAVSPLNIETEVTAVLGLPAVGQTLHVRAAVFQNATNLLSTPLIASVVTTTT